MTKQIIKSKVSRDKFIAAAFDLLCERGYAASSLEDIIEKAGRSKGAFYHHFESKEDVFHELFEDMCRMIELSTQKMKTSLTEGMSLREAALSSFTVNRQFLDSASRVRSLVELYFVGMRDPWVKKLLKDLHERIVRMFAEALMLAMRQGKIRPLKNPRQTAELLHEGSRGVLFLDVILNDGRRLRSKTTRWLDFQLDALGSKR